MPQRRQLWSTGARAPWSLRMFTNLAIYVYIYLQWAVVDGGPVVDNTHFHVPATDSQSFNPSQRKR